MYYLSIDVANKSLAVSFIYYNKYIRYNKYIDTNNINNTVLSLNLLNNNINNIIEYYICEVTDLIPNKKVKNTTVIERSKALRNYLMELKERISIYINKLNIKKIKLLIELQPSFNDKSKTTFNQIIYEFSTNEIYKIKIMNASYKNKIYFTKALMHSNFIKKYSNNYLANKNHTKYNFLYFLKTFNLISLIKNIKKKNYDDIADSFMQMMAYIYILQKNINVN
jgi:hypothetical protein